MAVPPPGASITPESNTVVAGRAGQVDTGRTRDRAGVGDAAVKGRDALHVDADSVCRSNGAVVGNAPTGGSVRTT